MMIHKKNLHLLFKNLWCYIYHHHSFGLAAPEVLPNWIIIGFPLNTKPFTRFCKITKNISVTLFPYYLQAQAQHEYLPMIFSSTVFRHLCRTRRCCCC